MFTFGYIAKENKKDHNPNWPEILDNPYRRRFCVWKNKYIAQFNKS